MRRTCDSVSAMGNVDIISTDQIDLHLIIVHGDVEFIVKFQSQTPYDSPEPQTVVGIHRLCLSRDIKDVLTLVQGTHILTYGDTHFSYYLFIYIAFASPLLQARALLPLCVTKKTAYSSKASSLCSPIS